MLRLCLAALFSLSLLAVAPAMAQDGPACAAKAVGKDGKPLAGAAKDRLDEKVLRSGRSGKGR